jgi:hypothetical protein
MHVPYVSLLCAGFAGPSLAYIDPGTGSYVLQLLLAGLLGSLFAVKIYWRRLRGFLSRGRKTPENDDNHSA